MEKKMPNAGLAVLEGAGHFSYAEKYPQFCAVMKAYLKALQNQYKNAMNSGQYTAELSYRMPLDAMVGTSLTASTGVEVVTPSKRTLSAL